MTRRKGFLILIAVAVALGAVGAYAWFSSIGTGTGQASTGALNAPAKPGAAANGSSRVDVTWHQATLSDGATLAQKYYVSRYSGATLDGYACGTSPSGTTIPASAADGSGNFTCSDAGLTSVGPYTYTVTAIYKTWTAESVKSDPVTVSLIGPLDHFLVTPASGTRTAGTPFSVTVTAKDASNNTITTYTGTIHFTSNDAQAVLPADYTFTTGTGNDNGVHTFTNGVTLKKAGTGKTVTVTDSGKTGTATYTVDPGPASQIVLSGLTTDLVSGSARTFTATVEDANGNTVTSGADSSVSVSFAQTGGTGSVTGTGSATASGGVATKSLTGNAAGSVTIRASATLSGSGATNSNTLSFNVVAGAADATQSTLTPTSSSITANGTATQVLTVQAKDANGNNLSSGGATVSITKQSGSGSIGSVTANGDGTYTATVTAPTSTGSGVFVATLNGSPVKSGTGSQTQATVSYVSGPVSQLVFTTQPAGATGGTALTTQPVVTAEDANGNTVTAYGGSVSLSIKSGTGTTGATLSGCSGSLSNGVTTFSGCKIDKAGSGYVLTASDGTRSVNSNPFAVGVGNATKFIITASLGSITSGGTTDLTITAIDAGGNTATGYTGTKSLTFTGANTAPDGTDKPTVTNSAGTAVTFGTAENISFASGIAQVSGTSNGRVTLYKAETASISATDGTVTTQTAGSVTVGVGTAAKLAWTGITTTSPGTPSPNPCYFTCTYTSGFGNNNTWNANVSITDAAGNIVSNVGSGHNVTVTLGGSGDGSITGGSPATLTMPGTGTATSTNQVQFKGGHTGTWTNTLTATGTGFMNATASFTK